LALVERRGDFSTIVMRICRGCDGDEIATASIRPWSIVLFAGKAIWFGVQKLFYMSLGSFAAAALISLLGAILTGSALHAAFIVIRPRIEGLFARIERWVNVSNPVDTFWRSISRDNITTCYGKTAASRIAAIEAQVVENLQREDIHP
jgi:hypothetical protein